MPVLLLFAVGSCANGSETTEAGNNPSESGLASLGSCPESRQGGGHVDRAPAAEFVASTAEWVAVDLDQATSAVAADVDRTVTSEVSLPVRTVDASGETATAESQLRNLRLHGSLLEGLEWASENPGSELYLGLGGADYQDMALFALVVAPDGQTAFAGDCQRDALTSPLHEQLENPDSAIQELVGRTGNELQSLLSIPAGDQSDVTDGPVILNPEDADPALLAQLHLIGVHMSFPSDWAAAATACTRIEEGWNDCIPLDGSLGSPQMISAYVGESGILEVWLLDQQADVVAPLQMLGSITVPQSSKVPGGQISISLAGALQTDGTSVAEAAVVLTGSTP